jgi:signal transduction histidine kinase
VRLAHGQESNRAGSGLGMGISRNIITAHHGEIRLANHPQGGLVVSVLIPVLAETAPQN